jgi:hypothetical protein
MQLQEGREGLKEKNMDIERFDGTKERKEFKTVTAMMIAAVTAGNDPNTKKLTLHFPRLTIPKRKKK